MMRAQRQAVLSLVLAAIAGSGVMAQHEAHQQANSVSEEGLGRAHMDISCAPAVGREFDRALALLHNFWYVRAFERFTLIVKADPGCAMGYWGAAMTFNHPFWDPPSASDEAAARAIVEKGLAAAKASDREKQYLAAVSALYDASGGASKAARDRRYRDAMAAVHATYPDDETSLFYGLSILGAVEEGSTGFEPQAHAATLFEDVYRRQPDHPGVLHYLIHAYDDPQHAEQGLAPARRYAQAAAAVPHALHMPSHIFTRLGLWEESAATNLKGWQASEADVRRAHESGAYRDFHNLTYLEYAYLQLGRYREAQREVDIIAAQFRALPDKTTAPDTPELQSRHVRGRTIYAVPDRVVYGYFDMLTRLLVESGRWEEAARLPLVVRSRDFMAVQLQWQAKAAAVRGDSVAAREAATKLAALSREAGQHPFAQQIITLQTREAEAFAAEAAGDTAEAVAKLKEAVTIEESIDDLSQPPYPAIPANELCGTLLLELNRPLEAQTYFQRALLRTPNRPRIILLLAHTAQALGDKETAEKRSQEFLEMWKAADPDRPELAIARRLVRGGAP
jgi:tetratricopeptide (TPR) repeat protein